MWLLLGLNAEKCVVMRFGGGHRRGNINQFCYHLGGNPLNFVHSHRDLGMLVDDKPKFRLHVRQVVSRAAALSKNLIRCQLSVAILLS